MSASPTSTMGQCVSHQDINTTEDRPRHPELSTLCARLYTFHTYPLTYAIKPYAYAEAGFYYTGEQDAVRCFYCNLGMHHWSAQDQPWLQHAACRPHCTYLIAEKGEAYVNKVQQLLAMHNTSGTSTMTKTVAISSSKLQSKPTAENGRNFSMRWLENEINTPGTNLILQMGYSKQMISHILCRKYILDKSGFDDPCDLLNAVLRETHLRANAIMGVSLVDHLHAKQKAIGTLKEDKGVEIKEAKQECKNNTLVCDEGQGAEEKLCKVCFVDRRQYALLPCGHFFCCMTCSKQQILCGLCRRTVLARVKIFE